ALSAPVGGGTVSNVCGIRIHTQNLGGASGTAFGIQVDHPGIRNGVAAATAVEAIQVPDATVSLGNTTNTLSFAFVLYLGVPTYTSTTNVRTVTLPALLALGGPPVA